MRDSFVPIREHLEVLLPEGGRGRRLVGWGVVAWAGIGIGILVWAGARVLERAAGVIPFLVMAWLVVFVLNPAVKALASRGVPRRLAATVVFLLATGLTALLLALVIPALVHQFTALVQGSKLLVAKGGETLFDRLSESSNPLLRKLGDSVLSWTSSHAGSVQSYLQTVTGAGLRLAHFGLVLLLGGFLGYLLLLSLPETRRGLLATLPHHTRERVEAPFGEIQRIVSGYVRARLIVSAVVGIVATFGLWAIHMPFWLVLGIFVGVANLIPMLGSWIGGIPVAIVALLTKPPAYLFLVLAVIVIAHAIDGYILSPVVLKETTKLHPVIVLLAVLLGADLAGFWGILAAIPVAGIVQYGLKEWVVPRYLGSGVEGAQAGSTLRKGST